jgi:hypothetical protein
MELDQTDVTLTPEESAPFGVKLLICFLLADAVRRGVELAITGAPAGDAPSPMIFILWILIDLLLALLMALRTRAGRYWTQAILAIHVFYLGHELSVRDPYLWLSMGVVTRCQTVATILLDGLAVAYLSSSEAKTYLQDGP